MKLIELINEKNSRSVDIVDNIYDFVAGIDLEKTNILDNYDVFHNYFIEQVNVVKDLGDRIIIDTRSFVIKNETIFNKLFPNSDLESQVDFVYLMEVGNCPMSIYNQFAEEIEKNNRTKIER